MVAMSQQREEYKKVFDYFKHAGKNTVLSGLQYSFEAGPIEWSNPSLYK